MINLRPTNEKLSHRMERIVSDITGVSETEAAVLLKQSDWNIRRAVSLFYNK